MWCFDPVQLADSACGTHMSVSHFSHFPSLLFYYHTAMSRRRQTGLGDDLASPSVAQASEATGRSTCSSGRALRLEAEQRRGLVRQIGDPERCYCFCHPKAAATPSTMMEVTIETRDVGCRELAACFCLPSSPDGQPPTPKPPTSSVPINRGGMELALVL